MLEFVDPLVFWGMWVLIVAGFASITLARLQPAGWLHGLGRSCFFGCLLIVGVATMLAIGCRSGCWVWCGSTFSLMAVGATLDVGGSLRPSGF